MYVCVFVNEFIPLEYCCTQYQGLLCYPCLWRRKIAQISGEWFDEKMAIKVNEKVVAIINKFYFSYVQLLCTEFKFYNFKVL